MRGVKVFSGNSHPNLTNSICERLGVAEAKCDLTKFSNGETSVSIGPSIRNQDVYIVQSGSESINDSVMEVLIMASACKGGSAKSITAVLPYFPYSRQSKKKSHRGAITARMLANLLDVAGVTHVITVDLHATPIQGFFSCPVDNLRAEPLIARWIRNNVPEWKDAVVVSKNAGGSKRVTSMADMLKLNFGIITTDRRREHQEMSLEARMIYGFTNTSMSGILQQTNSQSSSDPDEREDATRPEGDNTAESQGSNSAPRSQGQGSPQLDGLASPRRNLPAGASPLSQATSVNGTHSPGFRLNRSQTAPLALRSVSDEDDDQFTSERTRDVVHGRLIHGHIVDDDHPSPALSGISSAVYQGQPNGFPETPGRERQDPMTASFMSTASSIPNDATAEVSDDEEASLNNPDVEHTITLVGDVKNKTVFLVDDMIDSSQAWIAAAETVRKRGDADKVYCIATHGLFGSDSLEQLQSCDCIDHIVVTNSFPISPDRRRSASKLAVLDIAGMLAEAIRRNQHGESITQLYQAYQD